MTTKPTPAALRAATVIAQQLALIHAVDIPKLATLIDQQTGLPELVEALKGLDSAHLAVLGANMNGNTSLQLEKNIEEKKARDIAREVIKKHTT